MIDSNQGYPESFLDEEREDVLHVGFQEHVAALHGKYKNGIFYPEELSMHNLSDSERSSIENNMDEDGGIPIDSLY